MWWLAGARGSGANGPGSRPDRGHGVVFLGKTLSLTVPLATQVFKWVKANLDVSIPSRED